ncbi:MAG TPA: MupA/Atu3671 family FMN-dependent luciferase-like monooxygenase, partial [Pyrinomonadaceae bacterium]|nr:MupA/Atu3671 family FMN-dependent luciferase-like monooxygenase [Pyrinomonadaceae bacterium]
MMSLSERLAALPSHKRAKLAAQLPPLSFAQQRLWFLDQLEPNSAFYNIPAAVRLSGQLNIAALERTFTEIVGRHEALRTSFITIDGEARQLIAAPVPFKVPVVDLTTMAAELRSAEAERLARAEATTPFDLSAGELLRVQVLRVAADEHIVLLTLHHIISDGWSMGVLIREVGTLYQVYSNGQESPLEELAIQYGDYARWQREWLQGEVLEQQLGYWREQLAELPVLQIPADHTRPAVQTYKGSHHRFSIPLEDTQKLKDLSQQEGATLFMVLLAAFQLLLSRYSGQEDIVVGTAIAGRNRAETEKLIGCFVNTLVMRTDLSGGPTFRELVRRVREVCLGAYAHQDVPFEKLVEELQPERDLSRSPLFQTMFILQNTTVKEQQSSGALDMSSMGSETNTAQYDLVLTMIDDGQGTLEYNTDLFEAETVSRMCRHFQRLLAELAADPQQKIARVPMLSEAEREQILVAWNQTAVEYGPVECLHELFEQQVERTPEATALLFEEQSLNYRELNERANQLARHLRTRGVGPEVLVAVYLPRSIEMVVTLLGILKAGGAYLPLDLEYPAERLSFMLEDARVGLLLTESRIREQLPVVEDLEVICVDQISEAISRESQANLASGVNAENLAYVIYTSGSTGRPKGVMIPHQCVVNFFTGMDSALDFQAPGVWLAVTGISFDISVLELFWTITRGFSVVVHNERLAELRQAQRATPKKPLDFSLFYFASDGSSRAGQRYQLLLEGARFADEHGFSAVWTPERHFHDFGGLYPNPSVSGAAIAAITKQVQIRAGSVVLPLHHPVRVAEEWSMVDNISNGRVGISFASGWHAGDFVFAPERFAQRKQIMMDEIETVRRLWRREAVEYTSGTGKPVSVRIMPPPIQQELPVWLTAAGNPETFELAGKIGANLLTHLLGQSVEDLAEKIKIYRNAWKQAGHAGSGCVSLMLHTFVGERMDEVREQVRAPFTAYLASSLDLMRNLAQSVGINIDDKSLSKDDMAALLSHAFERYFETSGLLGTPEKCLTILDQLQAIDVDEVAFLVD